MMHRTLNTLILVLICQVSFADDAQDSIQEWGGAYKSAYPVQHGKLEMWLFHQWKYGIGNKIEIASNPIIFIPDPNLRMKILWHSIGNIRIATEHGFSIPTLLMRMSQISGAGGIISPQYDIPLLISINNAVRVSKPIYSRSLVSIKAGIILSIKGNEPDPGTSIDLPILYPRMAVFYDQPVYDLELNYQWNFSRIFKLFIGNEFFLVNRKDQNFCFEHSGNITWLKKRTGVQAGYKLCYGEYPFGNQWQLLPSLDILLKGKK
jgi:hypothetical protein